MEGLRWLLLLAGLLVIAGVYFYSRRERLTEDVEPAEPERIEPPLQDEALDAHPEATPFIAPTDPTPQDSIVEQKIVTLRLLARDKGTFRGEELVLNLRGIGMRHGKFGIFHRYEGNNDQDVVFSVASLVEPGSFDIPNIKEQQMMEAARALSQSLNAELLDESGSTLSIQRERYLREEIIQYQHGIMVA